nr:hypothetical protein [Marinicella sp. W31]MDC2879011.1 hypothetical protein [Marinicella sp. W31]
MASASPQQTVTVPGDGNRGKGNQIDRNGDDKAHDKQKHIAVGEVAPLVTLRLPGEKD